MILNLYEELEDTVMIANSFQTFGYTNYYQGKYSESLENFNKGLKLYKKIGDRISATYANKSIGDVFIKQRIVTHQEVGAGPYVDR